MVNALEVALDQEAFPQGEGAPWGSTEEGDHHDKVACQVEGALVLPWVQDLQNNNKNVFTNDIVIDALVCLTIFLSTLLFLQMLA